MTIGEPRGESGLVKRLNGLRRRAFSLGVYSAIGLGGLFYGGNIRAEEDNILKDPIGYIGGWLDPFIGGPTRSEREAQQEKEKLEFERKLKQAREGRETIVDEKNYVVEGNVWIDYNGNGIIDYNEKLHRNEFFSDEGATFILKLEPYMGNKTFIFELYDSNGKKANEGRDYIDPVDARSGYFKFSVINNFENYLPMLKKGENNLTARYVLSDGTQSTVIKTFPIMITKLGGEDVAEIKQLRN